MSLSRTVAPYASPDRTGAGGGGGLGGTSSFIPVTNSIESLNYQLRKIIKNRGHFPSDQAVVKLLWLATRDIEDKRARARAKDRGKPSNQRTAPGRLVEGGTIHGWKAAINTLPLTHPDRLNGKPTNHPAPSVHKGLDKLTGWRHRRRLHEARSDRRVLPLRPSDLIGRGKPPFQASDAKINLRLADTRTIGNGVLLLRYQRTEAASPG